MNKNTDPISDMDPSTYFAFISTPEGMKPIVDLETRMCIGYYDKEGAIYDFQGTFIEYHIPKTHPCYDCDDSSDNLYDFSKEVCFSILQKRLKAETNIIGETSKEIVDYRIIDPE